MIRQIKLTSEFAAVPYLPSTSLWKRHQSRGLKLSLAKPNVVIGPNGSGKTSLLTLLSLQTLTYFTGATALDDNYTRGLDADKWWSERTWSRGPEFLPGAKFDTDNAPALFYRPGHLAGNEDNVATAMMVGYFEEARAFGNAVKARSSGQGCQALLSHIRSALGGPVSDLAYSFVNWSGGKALRDISSSGWVGPWDYRAEVLKARMLAVPASGIPMLILDEPEQSLDTRTELELWNTLANTDCASRQVVVATHSLYPILYPDRFNLIEAEKGYAAEIRKQLSSSH